MKSKRSKACDFSLAERMAIYERDRDCIFCKMSYARNSRQGTFFGLAHIVPRSHGGKGVKENAVLACQFHHNMMDNGKDGKRDEMLGLAIDYLKQFYPDWSEEKVTYNKFGWLEKSQNDKEVNNE